MTALVLDDGNRGNFVQAFGIARRLSAAPAVERIVFRGPGYRLPGRAGRYPVSAKAVGVLCALGLWSAAWRLFQRATGRPAAYWAERRADAVISAGSLLAPATALVGRFCGMRSVTVMVPALLGPSAFDAMVVPYHDALRMRRAAPNVVVTLGAPNGVTREGLAEAVRRLDAAVPPRTGRRRVGLLVGGDDQNYRIDAAWARELLAGLDADANGYDLLATTSRRTPAGVAAFLREYAAAHDAMRYLEIPGESAESHYHGILGGGDCLLVTEDSVNMVSEAASSGRPTVILQVGRKHGRPLVFDRTMERLVREGYAAFLPRTRFAAAGAECAAAMGRTFRTLDEAELCARRISKIST